MANIYKQARTTSLVLAEDSLIRMKDNTYDSELQEAIDDAITAIRRVLDLQEEPR